MTNSKIANSLIYPATLVLCIGIFFLYLWMLIKQFSEHNKHQTKKFKNIQQKKDLQSFLIEGPQSWRLPTLPLGIAVPSALTGLTSLFGMGRGGSPSLLPPFIYLFLACAMVVWSGYHPVYGVRERKNIVYPCYVVNY